MAAPSKTFATIADAAVDADSPLDATLMTGLRDSLIHLEEWLGMSYTAAQNHDHDGVNSAFVTSVADGAITPAKIGNVSAGDWIIIDNATERSTISATYVKLKEIKISAGGTYRVKFSGNADGGTAGYKAQVYKNGSAHGTERQLAVGYQTWSEDLTFAAGDLIQVYAKTAGTSYAKDFQLGVSAPLTAGWLYGY